MTYDDVDILTDQEVRDAYHDVYNGFWRRHNRQASSCNCEEAAEQGMELMEKYRNHPLVVHQIQDLMDLMEARSKRGEKR